MKLEKMPKFAQRVIIKIMMSIIKDFIETRKKNSHKKGLYDLQRALRLKLFRLEK